MVFYQLWKVKAGMEVFDGGGTRECDPVSAFLHEAGGGLGAVFFLWNCLIYGDVINNCTHSGKGFGELWVGDLSARKAEVEIFD